MVEIIKRGKAKYRIIIYDLTANAPKGQKGRSISLSDDNTKIDDIKKIIINALDHKKEKI